MALGPAVHAEKIIITKVETLSYSIAANSAINVQFTAPSIAGYTFVDILGYCTNNKDVLAANMSAMGGNYAVFLRNISGLAITNGTLQLKLLYVKTENFEYI